MAASIVQNNDTELRRCRVTIPAAAKLSKQPFASDLILRHFSLAFDKHDGTSKSILLEDLIGVTVSEEPVPTSQACRIIVNAFPKDRKKRRSLQAHLFDFTEENAFEENIRVAREWKEAVMIESNRAVRKTFDIPENIGGFYSATNFSPPRFMVFINPVGGPGKGVTLFNRHVRPMFEMAEIKFTVTVTDRINHARELVKDLDLSTIDGIVVSSGDGLVYEVVNGLMERDDWQTAIKTPIGVLPTGSGNALATTVLQEADEEFGLLNAAFAIIRGGLTQADLATVHTQSGKCIYMSLLSSLGFAADTDIESEPLRKIGEARFLLGAVKAIIKKKSYLGRLHYLPADEDNSAGNDAEVVNGKGREEDEASNHQVESKTEDIPTADGATSDQCRPLATPLLPMSLNDPVPKNWRTLEGRFIAITSYLQPFLAHGFVGVESDFLLGSGVMHIVYVSDNAKRKDMINIIRYSDTGAYLQEEFVHDVATRAYRLELLDSVGHLTIDGEEIEYGPHQVQLHSRMLHIMSRRRSVQTGQVSE